MSFDFFRKTKLYITGYRDKSNRIFSDISFSFYLVYFGGFSCSTEKVYVIVMEVYFL